ncbi:MAG: inositol monophosphatase [Muribaculum sp.]|nr:inositol monophosphatase [Muribaculum sp.]
MELYDEIRKSAMTIARSAGDVQMKYFRQAGLDVAVKLNEADIVTEADKASERIILDGISSRYSGHAVLSEESGVIDGDAEWRWIVDPLDGTTNFAQGLKIFSVSIAVEHRGEVVVGVVYAPAMDEMFCAVKGRGATLNGMPVSASVKSRLDRCVVSTGFPVDRADNPVNNYDNVLRVLPLVRGLRRLGSAAVDLCYTAAGYLDAYWEMNLHEWDIAAGRLIAQEAGVTVSEFRNDRNLSILAAPPAIHALLNPLIR